MAMGKRHGRGRQPSMWVSSSDLPRSAGHPFYERLNRVLDEAGFDAFVEEQCAKFYADGDGRPSLAPGRYCRMLLLGHFEGLDSGRAIAWPAADSVSLRQFLDVSLDAASPDHSTVSRTKRRIDVETFLAVFTWVLQRLSDAGLVKGKTVGIDATTLEANATIRSIVRRDTGAGYETFLRQLAAASGIATPTRAELARLDRKRRKKGSNDELDASQGPGREDHEDEGRADAAGAQGRACRRPGDGRGGRHLCPGRGCRRHPVDARDAGRRRRAGPCGATYGAGIAELVCDKGYHSNQTLVTLAELGSSGFRTASGIGSPPKGCASPWPTTAPRRAFWGRSCRPRSTDSRPHACRLPSPRTTARSATCGKDTRWPRDQQKQNCRRTGRSQT